MDLEQKASVPLHASVAARVPVPEEKPITSSVAAVPGTQGDYPDLTALLAALEYERIAALAYFYWQQRGCPEGSSDEDWFAAQRHIREDR